MANPWSFTPNYSNVPSPFGPTDQPDMLPITVNNPIGGPFTINGQNPYAGMPSPVNYKPAYNASTMAMDPAMEQGLSGIQVNRAPLQKFEEEATRSGPSAWAKLAQQKNSLDKTGAIDNLASSTTGQNAQAENELAMRGGMTSGARERLAASGRNSYLTGSQGIQKQAADNGLQIGMNDEQNRIQQLSMAPGMEAQMAGIDLDKLKMSGQAKQFDVNQQVSEGQALNQFNQAQYGQRMSGWAGKQQSDAIANSGKH